MNVEWLDVLLHMGLEAVGSLCLYIAYQWCHHRWHQAVVWIIALFVFSLATVNLVG